MRVGCWFLFLLFLTLVPPQAQCATSPNVHYDAAKNQLSVRAENASLTDILSLLALQTGIKISMPPAAETKLDLDFSALPLETGLKRLLNSAGVSHLLLYGQGANNAAGILSLKILPSGGNNDGHRGQTIPADGRTAASINSADSALPPSVHDSVRQHWAEHLATLPPAKQEQMETRLKQKQEQRQAEATRQAEHKAEQEQRRSERAARLQAWENGEEEPSVRIGAPNP